MISWVLAAVGALLVAVGAALVYVPAGLIAAGLALIAGAYVRAYLEAQHATPATARPRRLEER